MAISSRMYSAIESPASATRMRDPGGSFICPKARDVRVMTPLSRMSAIKSVPSRLRSPTPAKTE